MMVPVHIQVKRLEEHVEELDNRLRRANARAAHADRRAQASADAAKVGVGSRDSYEKRINALIRTLESRGRESARLLISASARVAYYEKRAYEAEQLVAGLRVDIERLTGGPEMTATEVLLRKELRRAEARVIKAEDRALKMAEYAIHRPLLVADGEPLGWGDLTTYGVSFTRVMQRPPATYFWLGEGGWE